MRICTVLLIEATGQSEGEESQMQMLLFTEKSGKTSLNPVRTEYRSTSMEAVAEGNIDLHRICKKIKMGYLRKSLCFLYAYLFSDLS